MSSEKQLEELSLPEYWDTRYAAENEGAGGTDMKSFEWFRDFSKLRGFFANWLPAPGGTETLLHLGCGNSTLTSDLYHAGYKHQICVDFSQVVITAMMTKYAGLNQKWAVMDVRQLELQDSSIDLAIDKGTLDAFLHGSLWSPPDDVITNVGAYVDEVARVLKPGGKWLYITYRQPHFMKPLLEREKKWTLEVQVLEDPDGAGGFEYFGFIMMKNLP
ncbi:Endothelin-converting enzyme 2 [Diplocarpon rosae]|nr:Endothelin-converting enzyme 2 [Diplocarpon rosae]